MRVISVFLALLLSHAVAATSLEDSVRTYQEALIRHGVTGSSVAGVFKGSEVLAMSAVASDLPGDKAYQGDHLPDLVYVEAGDHCGDDGAPRSGQV